MNSVLNPEAPEFYPHLSSFTQDGLKKIHDTVKLSNTFPSGFKYDLLKTYNEFNLITNKISENVVAQANKIVAVELPNQKLHIKDSTSNRAVLTDVNNSLLDKVHINIDKETGVNEPSEEFIKSLNVPSTSSWNQSPVITRVKMGSTTLLSAKNIVRPQLNFKDPIDNSENLWVPKLPDKPNSITPLALKIIYDDESKAVGYEHPYKIELDSYRPPAHFLERDTTVPVFPLPLSETLLTYVDTEAKLDALVEHLNTVTELAVDLEHHSYRSYQGITCLIQITTAEGGDFIIDAFAVREHIHKLNLAFTDPRKVKVLHGAESDVLWLQRDFGVYIVGLFDTHQAAKILELKGMSLKFLLMEYCQMEADKTFQLADWRMRPLPEELIKYARMDTHYLIYIWRLMKEQLLEKAAYQSNLLLSAFDQSRQICELTYNKEVITDESHMPLYTRSKQSFSNQQLACLQLLYKYRDAQARLLDESTTYLLPNHMLLALAQILPREVEGVNAICCPMPPFVKQNLITIHRMILSCRQLPLMPQVYRKPKAIVDLANAVTKISHDVHDLPPRINTEEQDMNVVPDDKASEVFTHQIGTKPSVKLEIILPSSNKMCPRPTVISNLNAEAKQFVPPHDRYRVYRSVVQMQELKDFNEKEAKVAALSKDNELIKTEVLNKLQQAKSFIENEEKKNAPATVAKELDDSEIFKKPPVRKRKISNEKPETLHDISARQLRKNLVANASTKKNDHVKTFPYQNANYRKFYKDPNKQKQIKMKLKKQKK